MATSLYQDSIKNSTNVKGRIEFTESRKGSVEINV